MTGDPQHPFEDERPRHAAWVLDDPEPTNLVALWPDEAVPSRMEVLTAFASVAGESVEVLDDVGDRSPEFEWAAIIRVPGFERPLAVWTEAARPLGEAELAVTGGVHCPWVVGIEGVLEESDPLRDYTGLMRLMLRALPDAPAVLDVTTSRWTSREGLEAMFEQASVEPPADVLWVVEARRRDDDGGLPSWLRTRGLARCGRPELEMLDVPGSDTEAAAQVLSGMAAMLFEAEPPDPGTPWPIGHDLSVALVPWGMIEEDVDGAVVGGPADRPEAGEPPSAVVCDVGEGSEGPDLARLRPERVIHRLGADEACGLYWTERATRRQSDLARAGWDQFATAWAAMRKSGVLDDEHPPAVFGLKAGYAVAGRPDLNHEHVWFRLRGLVDDGVEAELVNEPVHDVGLAPGDRVVIEPERVADWLVVTRYGSFGPGDVPGMWRAVDRLRAEHREDGAENADDAGGHADAAHGEPRREHGRADADAADARDHDDAPRPDASRTHDDARGRRG